MLSKTISQANVNAYPHMASQNLTHANIVHKINSLSTIIASHVHKINITIKIQENVNAINNSTWKSMDCVFKNVPTINILIQSINLVNVL